MKKAKNLLLFGFLVIVLFFIFAPGAFAADRFWVGGTGNWSDAANHWSDSSGGTPNASFLPTSVDDVYFDVNSHTASYTVTVDATANCRDMTWANPASGSPALAGSSDIHIYGSLVLVAGMGWTTYYATLNFRATSGTKTITSNGATTPGNITFNGSGGTFQLADDITFTRNITRTAGTFDPNGKTATLNSDDTARKIVSAFTWYNLSLNSTAVKSGGIQLFANQTVTNNLSINGNSAINRILIASDTRGAARTITAANVSVTNADFRDITGAGAGSWDLSAIAGGSGDCGGNSNITFTPAKTWFYHAAEAGANQTSTVGKWFDQTNGAGNVATYPPLPQDTQKFDANSFDSASITVTQDMPRIGSVDWTGATNTPIWTTSTEARVFGGITLIEGMTLTASTQYYAFEGRGAFELTSAGKTWAKYIYVTNVNGNLTLQDAFNSTTLLYIQSGSFTANDQNVTSTGMYSNYNDPRTISMGAGTWTLTGTSPWNANGSNITITASTSTIKFTNTSASEKNFYGNSKSYNNLWFSGGAGGGSYVITGTNTFTGWIKDDGTAAHSITFPNVTTTVADFQVSGSAGQLITLQRTGASGTFTLAKTGGGAIYTDYLSISNSAATPANTWYCGANCVDGGGNSGWVFDSTAPVTTDDTDADWHNAPVTVTLTPVDTESGVANTYYTTDGSTPTTDSSSGTSVVLSDDGIYTIKYFSVDNVGNEEAVKTAANQVKIDLTAPGNIGISSVTANSASQITAVALTATDAVSNLHTTPYFFNETSGNTGGSSSSDYQTSTSFVDTGLSPNIQYSYQVKAKDTAGNASEYSSATAAYTLANVPSTPTVTALSVSSLNVVIDVNSNPASTQFAIYNDTLSKYVQADGTLGDSAVWQTYALWGGASGISITGLSENTQYAHQVKARNGDETETELSDGTSATTNATPVVSNSSGSASGRKSSTAAASPASSLASQFTSETKSTLASLAEKARSLLSFLKFEPDQLSALPPEIAAQKPSDAMSGDWSLVPAEPVNQFLFASLPPEIQNLTEKFPELAKTFKEIGITKISDLQKLKSAKFVLPGLNTKAGLAGGVRVAISSLTKSQKALIPAEVIFAKAGDLIDYSVQLTINEEGIPEQRITTIVGRSLDLAIKEDKPVNSIKGYVVVKNIERQQAKKRLPADSLLAAAFLSSLGVNYSADEEVKIEEKLVVGRFDYSDEDKDGIYTASITSPLVHGEYEIISIIDYKDPALGKKELRLVTVVDPEGYVYEKHGNKETRIPDAKVSVYWKNSESGNFELWPAKNYQQTNPQKTDKSGTYSFLVPEGVYKLSVDSDEYYPFESSEFDVQEGRGVHQNIEMKPKSWWRSFFNLFKFK